MAETTLLIVDDEPANLAVLSHLLEPHYRVRAASSGARALEAVARPPCPALILLDVMMPDMDGYAVLERLREDPASRDIPVIFVTALADARDEERGLALGAADYIAKPIQASIVLARVRTQLELKQARDRLREQNALLEAEVARRVAEAQQVELQLLQAEKMAAIGLLSAGIAHEINNPISYVASNLESLERYVGEVFAALDAYRARPDAAGAEPGRDLDYCRADIGQLLAESRDGLQRVRDIVRDLKGFSRKEEGDWQWADLHKGLDATLRLVWNELKYNCTVHKEYGRLPPIWCLPSQLNQVFLNLLVNAAQAIEAKGEVYVRTGHDGDEVWIEVADTGKGIDPELQGRIFEPFYTTKPVGQGTGLGLALSAGIAARHGGRIEVRSQPGLGAAFRMRLPVRGPGDLAADHPA